MNLLALIPARGGSKGIPRKNIRLFCGKPLLQWSIKVALEAPSVNFVVVSTEDIEVADIARACGAEVPFFRPADLATDASPAIATVLHALDQLPDVTDVLFLQPTSPLRTTADIEAIVELRRQAGCESAVSLTTSSKHPAWMYTLGVDQRLNSLLKIDNAYCRQQLEPAYVLNGACYLASRDFLLREKSFVTGETVGYVMPPDRSIDIDTPFDWQLAEFQMRDHLR